MTTLAVEPTQSPAPTSEGDDDIWHAVCHCTSDNTAACGLDVSGQEWGAADDDNECILCEVVWPPMSPACPWGCACDECGWVE